MKIRFIGDVHEGKKPAHSTKASAVKHSRALCATMHLAAPVSHPVDYIMSLGDLFDSYTVSNNSFVNTLKYMDKVDVVLMGNHDHSHNANHVSALADFGTVTQGRICTAPQSLNVGDGTVLYMLPYMPTQAEFLNEVNLLLSKDISEGGAHIVCMHTNMYPEGFEVAEVENNLPLELAEKLSDKFDLVISGHEHNHSIKGGVVMAGCVMPHGFGDISDKFVWDFDTETKVLSKVRIWSSKDEYIRMPAQSVLDINVDHQFTMIELTGEVESTELLPIVKKVSQLFSESGVFCIKSGFKLAKQGVCSEGVIQDASQWISYVKKSLTEKQCLILEEMMQ